MWEKTWRKTAFWNHLCEKLRRIWKVTTSKHDMVVCSRCEMHSRLLIMHLLSSKFNLTQHWNHKTASLEVFFHNLCRSEFQFSSGGKEIIRLLFNKYIFHWTWEENSINFLIPWSTKLQLPFDVCQQGLKDTVNIRGICGWKCVNISIFWSGRD